MRERDISTSDLARAMAVTSDELDAILAARQPISIAVARRLSTAIGGTVGFWIARDGQYREDLARVVADEWAETLPIKDMASYGWIDRPTDWSGRIDIALSFFDVPDVDTWSEQYLQPLRTARLRVSARRPPKYGSMAAWLRQAEKQALALECKSWNPSRFAQVLSEARALTRLKNPATFGPKLQQVCATAGVAVVMVRPPEGCTVSGAARFLADNRGLIALTARHQTDDHLWFTFFHEAAHLLLDGAGATYVDEMPEATTTEDLVDQERAADDLAARYLLSQEGLVRLETVRLDVRGIMKLANELNVAPGIIVGQLQYRRRLGFGSGLSHLKRRYRWVGATLEMR
jgi:plasmid maintenance system antidote protein VapI